MGGSTIETKAEKVANIQIQSSSYGLGIPVIYGTARVSANMLWFGNFTAIAHTETTSQGGKGLGKVTSKNTTYTYTAAAIMALGQGVISGIGSVWRDKDKTTLSALGLTLFTGTPTQPVWSFLTSWNVSGNWNRDLAYGYAGTSAPFTDQAINYSEIAYVAASAYDLGDTASVPNHGFEAYGKMIYGGGIQDANPADIVPDMLSSTQYGLGFGSGQIDSLSLYSTYCRAAGLFVSPVYDEQRPGSDCLGELVEATNSDILWSGGKLKILPRGDTAMTGNGATYTPDLTPLYDLTDDDFLDPENPVRINRRTPADAKNRLTVSFLNRANDYNTEIVPVEDQDAIEKYGLKQADPVSMPMFKDASIAKFAAQLKLQRMLNIRNDYDFEIGARFARLEPGDLVTVTDPGQDLYRQLVKLTLVDEQEDGFYCEAEEMAVGTASAARYAHDNGLRWKSVINQAPQNCAAPIIFELPADPSIADSTGLSVAIAVGGQTTDPLYGGCRVWLSLDGTNYKAEGIIYGSSRYGTIPSALAGSAPGLDNTNTLAVILRSNGQITTASAADRDKKTTLVNVGGEYLSFQNATLTGTNAYSLYSLNRGLYGTNSTGTKAIGSPFVYVDNAIAILKDLDLSLIGQTVYIKVTAFNTYAAGEQDLASVSAYTYTITGNMKALETPVDFLTGVGGAEKPEINATRNVNRGAWSGSSIAYVVGDEVQKDGSSWVSQTIHTSTSGNGPPTLPTISNTNWMLRAKIGDPGSSARVGFLTNESHTIAADSAGTVASFTGAGGTFKVFDGLTDVTASSAFSVASSSGVTIGINATTGVYTVTAMSADTGVAVLQAVYGGTTILKDYSIAKSRAGTSGTNGSNGVDAKTLYVTSTFQTVTYDGTGALSPATQTNTFDAVKQNTTGTVTWTITDNKGNALTPGTYLSATTGNSVTMTASNFGAALAVNGATGLTVIGAIAADGLSDKISVAKVRAGATGAVGVTVSLTAPALQLDSFADGTLKSGALTNANGVFKIKSGSTDLSSGSTFSVVSNTYCTVTIDSSGNYAVTGATANNSSAVLRASYAGADYDLILSIAKSLQGSAAYAKKVSLSGTLVSTTYVTVFSNITAFPTADGQGVQLSASGTYTVSTGGATLMAKLQYQINGGSFIDVAGSEVTGTPTIPLDDPGEINTSGIIPASSLASGDTVGVRLVARRTTGTTSTSFRGQLSTTWANV